MKTQNQMLMSHLERRKYIDPMEAAELYGIQRLAARAGELQLVSERVKGKNRFGQPVSYCRYSLQG